MNYQVYIHNEGAASAHEVCVEVEDNVPYAGSCKGLIPNNASFTKVGNSSRGSLFSGKTPIHPGFSILVATSCDWSAPQYYFDESGKPHPRIKDVDIKISVYCRDADCQCFQVAFQAEDLIEDPCRKKCQAVR
jgi:hypothetical protein